MGLISSIVGGSAIAAVILLSSLWIFKKAFEKLIERSIKKEIVNYSEMIRKDTETALSNHRHSLAIELAKMSNDLAVTAETYKLAAQHRYKILEVTWILFRDLEFDLQASYSAANGADKAIFAQKLHKAFMNLYNDRVYFSKDTYAKLDRLFGTTYKHSHEAVLLRSSSDLAEVNKALNELLEILRDEMGSKI